MNTKMIEKVKVAQKEHSDCFDTNGTWIGYELSPLEEMAEELAERILANAETLKAAERLAVVAMNTGCATRADADQLKAAVDDYRKASENHDG